MGTNNPETTGLGGYTLPLAETGVSDRVVCMTCHRPHGTAAAMTGFADPAYDPPGTLGPIPAGDSSLLRLDNRGVCQVCHQVDDDGPHGNYTATTDACAECHPRGHTAPRSRLLDNEPPTLVIVKDAVPADGTDFAFTSDITGAPSFSLDDLEPVNNDDGITDTIILDIAGPGVYTVTEQLPSSDWVLWDIECVDPTANSSGDTGTRTATINLSAGERVTCTFRNAMTGTIALTDGTMLVIGSGNPDKIIVKRFDGSDGTFRATIEDIDNAGSPIEGEVAALATERFVLHGLGGDDIIRVHLNADRMPAELYGGPGRDILISGKGADVLVGGPGRDWLRGAIGRNVLLGGTGIDRLEGDDQQDLLVADVYADQANRAAIRGIAAEWQRAANYIVRTDNLSAGGGLNGSYVLNNTTVTPDGAKDTLLGMGKLDWFLGDPSDNTDWAPPEILTPI